MKRILIVLNYYTPYVSGVTEYARLAAEMLVNNGYEVSVLATRHTKDLLEQEIINGVKVYRANVLFRISKGVISPAFLRKARKLSKEADVVNLHVPMLEAGWISAFIPKQKLVTMYQCDVNLPPTLLNRFIVGCMDFSHRLCLNRSKRIIVTSLDYAAHSRVAAKHLNKTTELAAPVKEYSRVEASKTDNEIKIGFCGRIVEEKGIDVLIKAFQLIQQYYWNARLLIAGDYQNIAGGSIYPRLTEYIKDNKIEGITFLGKLKEEEMPGFFSSLDVFVLPSINSLEAFGMVQVEAMQCGTPVVASDLYGVRTIVQRTGAGLISKAGDDRDLAECIMKVINHQQEYAEKAKNAVKLYSNDIWSKKYRDALLE